MKHLRLFSGGPNIDQESSISCKPGRKKIAKPARLILSLYIIRGIKIKRIEETNREISKGYEQFTKNIYISFKHENMVNFTKNSGNKNLNYPEIKSKDLIYPKKFLKKNKV